MEASMAAFLLWFILLVVCWPLALLALLLYPLVWLLLLPFRILGFAVEGTFGLVRGLFQADRYWSLTRPPLGRWPGVLRRTPWISTWIPRKRDC
jgi:hypothetical protein